MLDVDYVVTIHDEIVKQQGVIIDTYPELEEIMVEVANGHIDQEVLAEALSSLWAGGPSN